MRVGVWMLDVGCWVLGIEGRGIGVRGWVLSEGRGLGDWGLGVGV